MMPIGTHGYRLVAGKLEHRLAAERALGRTLPAGACVHHINGNRLDNAAANLVICPDTAYHALLHYRERALDACGNANHVKCVYCKQWGPRDSMYVRDRPRAGIEARHRACHSAAVKAAR